MVIRILLICSTLFLAACFHNKPKDCPEVLVVKPQIVERPVFACPSELKTLQQPTRPDLAFELLSDEDKADPGKVGKYYKISIKQLQNYAKDLESVTGIQTKVCEGLPSVIVPAE